jgi:hypothetical protein
MDINEWNAVFVLMGESVVCSGSMVAQPLSQSEERFRHSPGCKHDDEDTQHPWKALHDILDKERG